MNIRTWDGSRPRKCDFTYCAASEEYWFPRMAPKRFVRINEDADPSYEWSSSFTILEIGDPFPEYRTLWYFCEECHEIMDMEKLLLSKLRENVSIDATPQISESQ